MKLRARKNYLATAGLTEVGDQRATLASGTRDCSITS